MQPPHGYPQQQTSQSSSSSSTIWIILAVVGIIGILGLGVLASLSIFGVRKYLANAKQAEVLNSISQIQKCSVAAYEAEGLASAKPTLCASASSPIPASMSSLRGTKYLAAPGEWQRDATTNAGFSCLKFEMSSPQYYQYDYQRTGTGTKPGDAFSGIGHGDLNGDGVESTYVLGGAIGASGDIEVEPAPRITNAGE